MFKIKIYYLKQYIKRRKFILQFNSTLTTNRRRVQEEFGPIPCVKCTGKEEENKKEENKQNKQPNILCEVQRY